MKHLKTFESFISEAKDMVTFSVNNDKLDQLLNDYHGRELDYVKIKGDDYYTLPKREFDRFIDAAYSKGFEVGYEGDDNSDVYIQEMFLSEGEWTNIMKGIKGGGSGPWTIVAIDNKKVIGQQIVKTKDAIPAYYESMKKQYPKVKLHIEDEGGQVVWVKESKVNEAKIMYQKGKSYQTGDSWTVYVDKDMSGLDIKVNNAAGWKLDPNDTREETLLLVDAGRQRASITFKEGNINAFAKKMWDMNDKTTWGEKQGLTADDYADIIRVWIDMRNTIRK